MEGIVFFGNAHGNHERQIKRKKEKKNREHKTVDKDLKKKKSVARNIKFQVFSNEVRYICFYFVKERVASLDDHCIFLTFSELSDRR